MTSLTFSRVTKRFGSRAAVSDLSFTVAEGEFFVVLGPSRSGKSTLLRLVAGLESPSSGTIAFGDRDVTSLRPAERDVGMFFQNVALYPNKTGRDNIAAPLHARRRPRAEVDARVGEVAELLGVAHLLDRRPETFSGGERQRVAIGRAIVRRAAIHLFDEPLSNLDALVRLRLRTEFKRLQRELGVTTMFVTPDQVEALALADRVMVLDEGRVAQVGTPEEVYGRPSSAFVASFVGSPPMNVVPGALEARAGHLRLAAEGGGHVDVVGGDTLRWAVGRPVLFGVRPEHLRLTWPGDGATLTAVEALGRRSVAQLEIGRTGCRALLGPDTAVHEGQPVAARCDAAAVHLFTRDGGSRLDGEGVPRAPSGPGDRAASPGSGR